MSTNLSAEPNLAESPGPCESARNFREQEISCPPSFIALSMILMLVTLVSIFSDVPFGVGILSSIAYVTLFAFPGYVTLRLSKLPLPTACSDTVVLSFIFGIALLGVWASACWLSGNVIPGTGIYLLMLAAIFLHFRFKNSERRLGSTLAIPTSVYLFSALYTFISVVLPFRAFSPYSLVREMYSDGFQRFGVIYGLAENVPPPNVFLSGAPLAYYWFGLLPVAVQHAVSQTSLFALWKVIAVTFCYFSVSAVWLLIAKMSTRRIASLTLLLAYAAPSFEIFHDPILRETVIRYFSERTFQLREFVTVLASRDPDHVTGMLTSYSDQLLLEDYLYVPQNAYALLLTLLSGAMLSAQCWTLASLAVATIVGTSTFAALPAFAALVIVFCCSLPMSRCLKFVACCICWSLTAAAICKIVSLPVWPLLFLSALGAQVCSSQAKIEGKQAGILTLQIVAGVLLLVTGVVCTLVEQSTGIFFWNYGLSFFLAVAAIGLVAFRRIQGPERTAVLWGMTYLLVHALITVLAVWAAEHSRDIFPHFAQAYRSRFSPFNYYHKVSKVFRILLSFYAAYGILALYPLMGRRLRKAAMLPVAIILIFGAVTSVVRALSYMRPAPVVEANEGEYLRSIGATPKTVVVVADFRNSQITELAPISAYYFSSWSGPANGLSPFHGNWSEQYVQPSYYREIERREQRQEKLFQAPDADSLRDFLKTENADLILTRNFFNFSPCAVLVSASPFSFLFQITDSCRDRSR